MSNKKGLIVVVGKSIEEVKAQVAAIEAMADGGMREGFGGVDLSDALAGKEILDALGIKID